MKITTWQSQGPSTVNRSTEPGLPTDGTLLGHEKEGGAGTRNLGHVALSEKADAQATQRVTPFVQHLQNTHTHRDGGS